jgi:hypothetical protein
MYQWVPQGGQRLLGNPSSKASEFLRAVFDAPEVGINTRNVDKVTIMPYEGLWESNVEWSFYILGYILKIKYKNMAIFANFLFPRLVIKILKISLHFWGKFSPVEKESAFRYAQDLYWWLRSYKVLFTSEENILPVEKESAFKGCTRSEYLSRNPGCVTKVAFSYMTTYSCETTKHLSTAVQFEEWDAFCYQLLPMMLLMLCTWN